jgi:hypothetical protein
MIRASLSLALVLASSSVLAQQAATPAKPAAAKVTKVAKASKPAKAPEKVEVPLPAAEGEQLAAAALTHFGNYDCEFKQTVQVGMNPKYDGYIDVRFGKQVYTMKPVLSSTGALRLEDVRGQTLMLQIAYKSMLMDVQAGHRIVDECVHEKQLQAQKDAAGLPQQALLSNEPAAAAAPR